MSKAKTQVLSRRVILSFCRGSVLRAASICSRHATIHHLAVAGGRALLLAKRELARLATLPVTRRSYKSSRGDAT